MHVKSYKVLFADDEYWTREKMARIIPWEKYSLEFLKPASDGEEVLERLSEEKPDILITDINMPYVNGVELLKKVHTEYPEMKGGFIHVPFLPQQTVNIKGGAPSMSAEDIAAGLKAAVETFIKDLKSLPLEEDGTAGITH